MSSQDDAWTDIDVSSNLDQKTEGDLWIVNVIPLKCFILF